MIIRYYVQIAVNIKCSSYLSTVNVSVVVLVIGGGDIFALYCISVKLSVELRALERINMLKTVPRFHARC